MRRIKYIYGPLATNLYRPLPWLLANLSVPWPIRDNFWQHILKEISHIYNISLKLFRLTKIGIIPSFGTRKCKNRIFWTFFSKMEKNVKFGQKFTPGEPNTFKNGSFCYLIFSKKFSLPISEKKFRWNSLIKYDWKINKKWILTPSGNHLPEKSETQKWRAVITNVHLERFKWKIQITSKFGKSNTPTCHGGWTSPLHDPNTCFSYVQKRHQYMGEIPK